jgi:hypothetical protein
MPAVAVVAAHVHTCSDVQLLGACPTASILTQACSVLWGGQAAAAVLPYTLLLHVRVCLLPSAHERGPGVSGSAGNSSNMYVRGCTAAWCSSGRI